MVAHRTASILGKKTSQDSSRAEWSRKQLTNTLEKPPSHLFPFKDLREMVLGKYLSLCRILWHMLSSPSQLM